MGEEAILVQGRDHEALVGGVVHVHVPEQDHHHHEDVETVVEVVRTLDHVLVVEMVVIVEEVIQDLDHLLVVHLAVHDEVINIKL